MVASVEIQGVGKQFGDHVALRDIDLTVHDNEFVSLLGPSGCGKTTLLRIVSGLFCRVWNVPESNIVHATVGFAGRSPASVRSPDPMSPRRSLRARALR